MKSIIKKRVYGYLVKKGNPLQAKYLLNYTFKYISIKRLCTSTGQIYLDFSLSISQVSTLKYFREVHKVYF